MPTGVNLFKITVKRNPKNKLKTYLTNQLETIPMGQMPEGSIGEIVDQEYSQYNGLWVIHNKIAEIVHCLNDGDSWTVRKNPNGEMVPTLKVRLLQPGETITIKRVYD